MGSTMLVAQSGGHLSQLVRLAPRLGIDGAVTWVTFDSPQARGLLRGQDVVYAHYTRPRDLGNVLRNVPLARRLMRERGVERVVSTGAAIAMSFLPTARALGLEAHYIESAARAEGPSLTGRLLQRAPGVRLYSQYPAWAGGRWRYRGAVYDGFEAGAPATPSAPLRVAVTVGTMPYAFRRFVEAVARALPEGAEVVLAQLGPAAGAGGLSGRVDVSLDELRHCLRQADVVICHGGVGSALEALEAGRCPVLIPRLRAHGEHIDDHQSQVAAELERRGLALARDPERLTTQDLLDAARRSVRPAREQPRFELSR